MMDNKPWKVGEILVAIIIGLVILFWMTGGIGTAPDNGNGDPGVCQSAC